MEHSNHAAAERQAIEAMLSAMFAAWNRGDLQAYAGAWSWDADFVNVLGMRRNGRAEILAELEFLHATRFRGTQIQDLGHTIRFLTPEIAVIQVRWEMRGDSGQPGHQVQDGIRRGVFTHVAQRQGDSWLLMASQNTDVQPIPDPLKSTGERGAAPSLSAQQLAGQGVRDE